jgi:exonuclease VII large subunit
MDESRLAKLSLACSFIGLLAIFFLSAQAMEKPLDIGDVKEDMKGMHARICGEVVGMSVSRNRHIFMDIADKTGTIDVVVFNTTATSQHYSIEEGSLLCTYGKIDVYKGRLEIIAEGLEHD